MRATILSKMTSRMKLASALLAAPLLLAGADAPAQPATSLSRMAPVDAYLMDRAEEIALAKSAAPDAISGKATVLVLTRAGYETAVTGSNGFVCLVERGFSGAPDWDERWNPQIRAAGCLNPQAVRSILPIDVLRTNMTITGHGDAEILASIRSALRDGRIPPLGPSAMCYMMSKAAYLTKHGAHGMAHLMFYIPAKDGSDWGANADKSPIMGGNYWFFQPEHSAEAAGLPPVAVLLIGSASWSDGTPAGMKM
jgi:hypothetical protein